MNFTDGFAGLIVRKIDFAYSNDRTIAYILICIFERIIDSKSDVYRVDRSWMKCADMITASAGFKAITTPELLLQK